MATAVRTQPPLLPTDADVLGRAGGENFTVASRLLPPASRRHLMAFYGYARLIDQLGDAYADDRLAALDWAQAEVAAALLDPEQPGLHPLIAAAGASGRTLGLDITPFAELIQANRMDQLVSRYGTWDDLLAYCRLSANPVGHLVLAAFGASSPPRRALSDRICSALQVAEHLQDVGEDAIGGRVYLPTVDLDHFGVDGDGLAAQARKGGRAGRELRALIAFEASRARQLLDAGAPLVGELTGRSRIAIAGFVAGGYATLDAIADHNYDPFGATARPAPGRILRRMMALLWSAHRASADATGGDRPC
jgi:squalene synthase HpnC